LPDSFGTAEVDTHFVDDHSRRGIIDDYEGAVEEEFVGECAV